MALNDRARGQQGVSDPVIEFMPQPSPAGTGGVVRTADADVKVLSVAGPDSQHNAFLIVQ
jgi:hypothetical protein